MSHCRPLKVSPHSPEPLKEESRLLVCRYLRAFFLPAGDQLPASSFRVQIPHPTAARVERFVRWP